eukprot:CAMPEP_0194241654 /NCGR_PEP_ID=MMETSP0158-20130606/7454_1 /TAXON_ID=33649 /ORGANISM="Thalassionema nitzschioides, Strain L26-B" /LENGTH=235 /DNA_ID=CAMNT_0038976589 /DNA_START=22 /DNA_END=729 /DNA_ORIENTATION=-
MTLKLNVMSLLLFLLASANSFQVPQRAFISTRLMNSKNPELSRQDFLLSGSCAIGLFLIPSQAAAAERQSLDKLLYNLMRVREATFQESRLITSGKFKDVQRANVKLAVKFIVNNYRLSDTIVQASAYIEDSSKRIAAGDVGQSAVQDLLTILEYFDSADVQNLKVGSQGMAGKESLVTQGLQSARSNIDTYLEYFPKDKVEAARKKVIEENELNYKEWDPNLGEIVNLPPGVGV